MQRLAVTEHTASSRAVECATIRVALAGQPNVGKSTIFNGLTGMNQHVGNWPGKTVEQKTGGCARGETQFDFVDLPGTYSLTANSEEERVARDYILHERPDVVVAVVDAAIPERSLYLLAELLLLPAPVVLVLNMITMNEITPKTNVKAMLPVTFAVPGIKPIRLLMRIKKNTVSRYGM